MKTFPLSSILCHPDQFSHDRAQNRNTFTWILYLDFVSAPLGWMALIQRSNCVKALLRSVIYNVRCWQSLAILGTITISGRAIA